MAISKPPRVLTAICLDDDIYQAIIKRCNTKSEHVLEREILLLLRGCIPVLEHAIFEFRLQGRIVQIVFERQTYDALEELASERTNVACLVCDQLRKRLGLGRPKPTPSPLIPHDIKEEIERRAAEQDLPYHTVVEQVLRKGLQ